MSTATATPRNWKRHTKTQLGKERDLHQPSPSDRTEVTFHTDQEETSRKDFTGRLMGEEKKERKSQKTDEFFSDRRCKELRLEVEGASGLGRILLLSSHNCTLLTAQMVNS